MRLGFAIAALPPRRRAAARRGLRGRRRELPAQVLRRDRRSSRAGRHDPVRLPRRRGRRAALRALDAPLGRARRPSTGRRTRRSPATGARSPTTSTPPSAAPGCASGARARPRSLGARLLGRGRRRARAVPRRRAASARGRPGLARTAIPAPRLHLEVRDDAGAARRRGRARHRDARLAGARGAPRRFASRSTVRRSRSAASTSGSACGADGRRTLHQLDDALVFLVYPDGDERGPRPPRRNVARRRRSRRSDELQDLPGLARADGARARSPVQAHLGRRGAASVRRALEDLARLARRGRDLLRPRPPRLQRRPHRSAGRRGPRGHALVRGHEWATSGPGASSNAPAVRPTAYA